LGFDLFDDIVDHSYQNMLDPLDRCYYALKLNLDLLQDFDRVSKFVKDNTSRFQHNLELCQKNIFVTRVAELITQFDNEIQQELKKLSNPNNDSIFTSVLGPIISASSPNSVEKI
jgi:hypothetical protein